MAYPISLVATNLGIIMWQAKYFGILQNTSPANTKREENNQGFLQFIESKVLVSDANSRTYP